MSIWSRTRDPGLPVTARPPAPLLRRATARHLTRHPWQLLLTILGVALGVAITVALDLAIQSSREAFRISRETVTGRATHVVHGGATGLPDSLPGRLVAELGIRAVAPVVEGYAMHVDHPDRVFRILGVDPFSEAAFRPAFAGNPGTGTEFDGTQLLVVRGAVLLSRETAADLGVAAGDAFSISAGGRGGELRVLAILEPEDDWSRTGLRDLLIVDIAEAQELLGRTGRIDRVDLLLTPPDEEETLREILAMLPPEASLEAAGDRTAVMQQMTRAFDLNLTALSLLGLIFGAFLIYNTMTFSVVQRRPLFGTLRAMGVTRGELLRGILGEAVFLGLAGAAGGILLGILLGQGLVRLVTRTINDLYMAVSVDALAIPPEVLIRGGLLGLGVTLLATLPPAWEATTVSPGDALRRSVVESRARELVPRAAGGGLLLLGMGVLLLRFTERSIGAAFAALFAIILGMALLVPLATVATTHVIRPAVRRVTGVIGGMAVRGVVTSLSRTAPAIAALVVAVSVTVGLGIMIESFRGSVVRWLDVTLQADLYVSPPSVVSARAGGELPPGLVENARSHPLVAGVSTYRGTEFATEYGWTRLVALDLHPLGREAFDFPGGEGEEEIERFRAGEGVMISEPFAFRHALAVGDTVRLPSEIGSLAFPILAVFRDYGSELGTIMLARGAWDRGWTDDAITSLGIFLADGADPAMVAADLRRTTSPESPVMIRENRELRSRSLEVFDRTFEVTRVLRLLAFLVAFIAVLSALMALQLERSRELGVLRASGMSIRQGWGLVTGQTVIMGAISGILAVPMGLVLAWLMIHVVNRRSFGWTVAMETGGGALLQAVLLGLAGAVLAGIYPAWKMSRTSPAEALAER